MNKREMHLQKKDFINPKINWEDKAKNIKGDLKNELISLSIVYVV